MIHICVRKNNKKSNVHDELFNVIEQAASSESEELRFEIVVAQCFLDKFQPNDSVVNCFDTASWFQSNFVTRQTMKLLNRSNHAQTNGQISVDLWKTKRFYDAAST